MSDSEKKADEVPSPAAGGKRKGDPVAQSDGRVRWAWVADLQAAGHPPHPDPLPPQGGGRRGGDRQQCWRFVPFRFRFAVAGSWDPNGACR